MKHLPASPVHLGRVALAVSAFPPVAVAILIAAPRSSTWNSITEASYFVCGLVAVLLGMVAVSRWRSRRDAMPRPFCAFVAAVLGCMVTLVGLVGLGWPSC